MEHSRNQRVLIGGDGALHLVFHHVLVFFLDHREQLAVVLQLLLARDKRVVPQPGLQFVEHHERVDAIGVRVGHDGVGDLVLDVARADAVHALVDRLALQLDDVVLGEARQRFAVVEFQFLEQCQVGVLGLNEARQHRPHGGDLDGVRGDVLAAHPVGIEVLLVNLDLVAQPGDVRDVDLHGAVAQRFHELVVLQAPIFWLVGVPEDDFVDVRLGELLGLDLMLLRGAEQVVQEGDVELQNLDELDQAAVGDVQLAVEVKGARVGVGAVLGDLAVIDVAGQLGRVLVLLILGLEGADADAVLLGQDQPVDLDLLFEHARPVAIVAAPGVR